MSALGYNDPSLHSSLKCYLRQGDVTIALAVKEGYTFTVSPNWDSPFGSDTAGEKVGKIAQLGQSKTGRTSISKLNSAITWTGSEPLGISFTGVLMALTKETIYNDVQKAYAALMAMASPNVAQNAGFGRRPKPVDMTILNHLIFPGVFIRQLPIEVKGRNHHKSGLPMGAEIQMEVSTETMLNFQDFANLFKKG